MEGTVLVVARLRREGDVDPDVPGLRDGLGRGRLRCGRRGDSFRPRGGRGRSGSCGCLRLGFLLRHLRSPRLLRAVLGAVQDLGPVHLDPALDIEPEAAPFLRDPLLPAARLDDEGVAGLVHDESADSHKTRVRRPDNRDLEPDELVLSEVHAPPSFAAGSFRAGARAFAISSARMIVNIRAMLRRIARIFPGDGGAPPIAATPRSCISSLRSSFSFSARALSSIDRISFVRSSAIYFFSPVRSLPASASPSSSCTFLSTFFSRFPATFEVFTLSRGFSSAGRSIGGSSISRARGTTSGPRPGPSTGAPSLTPPPSAPAPPPAPIHS